MKKGRNEVQERFLKFYWNCQSYKLDPENSEAARRKTVLLAQNIPELQDFLGDEPEARALEAYRIGKNAAKQVEQEQANASYEKDQAARLEAEAKAWQQEQNLANMEQTISSQRGRDKRLFFYGKAMEQAKELLSHGREAQQGAAMAWHGMNQLEQGKEQSWGTRGGIAAGITGSTAVGAAVAVDTMRKNANIRAENEVISKRNLERTLPMADAANQTIELAENTIRELERRKNEICLHIVEERPAETLMKDLKFDKVQTAFNENGALLIRTTVRTEASYSIAGEIPAVIDGCFLAEIYEDGRRVDSSVLNLPREGLDTSAVLRGRCLKAERGKSYTVVILPLALWLIERYHPEPIRVSGGYGLKRQTVTVDIPDLPDLIQDYRKEYPWKVAQPAPVKWQERWEIVGKEQKEKAEEEIRRQKKARQDEKKTIKRRGFILGAVLCCVGILGLPVVNAQGFDLLMTGSEAFVFLGGAWTIGYAAKGKDVMKAELKDCIPLLVLVGVALILLFLAFME